ncbi:MAG TPA: hypothetical protein VN181_16565 [Thermoanaerobaculia bacterium]|nr:hypothetical protein [Thermoanaerobaculia bacterium]
MSTPADRLNWINIALMVAALAAAIIAPFHVFLFAYAVLGPLHYLTEVSWLHDRHFFTPSRTHRVAWLVLVIATTIVMVIGYVSADLLQHPVAPTVEIGMFLLVFVAAVVASYVRHPINATAITGVAMAGILILSPYPAYGIVAYLLITIVHVFVFTAFFILAGAKKSRSASGYLSFAVFVVCAAASLLVGLPFRPATGQMREIYAAFEQLNVLLLRMAGRRTSSVYDASGVGVMRFVAFAYTYHYLNWFSKTSVIRWHDVSRRRAVGILAAWAAGLVLYMFSYRIGFAVFYVLSVIHVMLEFPLNHQTVANLFRGLIPVRVHS